MTRAGTRTYRTAFPTCRVPSEYRAIRSPGCRLIAIVMEGTSQEISSQCEVKCLGSAILLPVLVLGTQIYAGCDLISTALICGRPADPVVTRGELSHDLSHAPGDRKGLVDGRKGRPSRGDEVKVGDDRGAVDGEVEHPQGPRKNPEGLVASRFSLTAFIRYCALNWSSVRDNVRAGHHSPGIFPTALSNALSATETITCSWKLEN